MDPKRNSIFNLVESTKTGHDIAMDESARLQVPHSLTEKLEEELLAENKKKDGKKEHHNKKDKKKKKDKDCNKEKKKDKKPKEPAPILQDESNANVFFEEDDGGAHSIPTPSVSAAAITPKDESPPNAKSKKDKKKKDKKEKKEKKAKKEKKKKKEKGGNTTCDESELELDSDDEISLGSLHGYSSSETDSEHDDEPSQSQSAKGKGNKFAAGLSNFSVDYKPPDSDAAKKLEQQNLEAARAKSQQRRHTLGAALKGFQIDVGQAAATSSKESSEKAIAGLAQALPKISIGNVKTQAPINPNNRRARRESAYADFMNKGGASSLMKDGNGSHNNNNS